MENFDQIKAVMEAAEADVAKFVEKGNKADGIIS
jgi:hypothetical protein